MEEGQNVPAPTGGFFYSQICNFPKESFILSSPCNSAGAALKGPSESDRQKPTKKK
jgi:hypothetical protein